jgi:hypothetical protein
MKPVLQALVLAERIYEDKSGKKIIAGTFNQILLDHIPDSEIAVPDGSGRQLIHGGTDAGSPSAYISLTDVIDGTEITLQFVNVSKNKTLLEATFRLDSTDRLATVEIIAPLPPLRQIAVEPGTYSLDIVWNGEILGSHRLIFRPLTPLNIGEKI